MRDVWNTFIHSCTTVFYGYPASIRIDQGSQFISTKWELLAHAVGIVLKTSGIERYNSLGVGERYHSPLRRINEKTAMSNPRFPPILPFAFHKGRQRYYGPLRTRSYPPRFWPAPRLPVTESGLPDHESRIRALQVARRNTPTSSPVCSPATPPALAPLWPPNLS